MTSIFLFILVCTRDRTRDRQKIDLQHPYISFWFLILAYYGNSSHVIVLSSLCCSPYSSLPSHTSSVSLTVAEINKKRERGDSSVSTEIRLGAGTPWIRGSMPSRDRIFLFSKVSKLLFIAYRVLFL